MPTLRGSTAGAFTSNARTLTLPTGTVAGDYATVYGYDGFTAPTLSGITGWTSRILATTFGDVIYGFKKLTSGDITTGSVTITWNGSYGGYAAITTALCTELPRFSSNASASNGDTDVGRTISLLPSSGDIAGYFGFKRKDGFTPTVSIDRGTSIDASAVANVGGAYRTETHAATSVVTVTSTLSNAGNVDGLFAVVFSDSALSAATVNDANTVESTTPITASWIYKGRTTATQDTGSVA